MSASRHPGMPSRRPPRARHLRARAPPAARRHTARASPPDRPRSRSRNNRSGARRTAGARRDAVRRRSSLRVVQVEHREKRLLRNLDCADLLHAPLARLLALEELALPRDVAAVALREHILALRLDRL